MKKDEVKTDEEKICDTILNVGVAFDKVDGTEAKWNTLVMLLTGFMIEEVKEEYYEEALKDLMSDALDCVKDFHESEKNDNLLTTETKGNA